MSEERFQMDASRFDTWTRRRFGLMAGGVTASLLSLLAVDLDGSEARSRRTKRRKKKRQRDRCPRLGESCAPGGRACCEELLCEANSSLGEEGFACCKGANEPCETSDECCTSLGLFCGTKEQTGEPTGKSCLRK